MDIHTRKYKQRASNNIIQAEGTGYYVVEVEYINSGCKTIDSVFVSVNTKCLKVLVQI
ncbi:MAG: hypothetical protein IPF52_14440 [Saprospiraceae bacterium]|nr:hypothetical protein [Saprospiraceae bacterium]